MHHNYGTPCRFLIFCVFFLWNYPQPVLRILSPGPIPISSGLNFALAGYNYSQGGVVFDPTIPSRMLTYIFMELYWHGSIN